MIIERIELARAALDWPRAATSSHSLAAPNSRV